MKKLDLTGLGDLAASVNASNVVNIGAQRASFEAIPLEYIRASTTNPRKHFNSELLADLAASIRQMGLAQPIMVRPIAYDMIDNSPVRYEIVAGERRYRASHLAGYQTILAVVRDLSDAEALELQVIENLQRADLHPLEEAEGYEVLMKAHDLSAEQLAVKVGKSKAYIYARLKLCALVPEAREAFYAGKLTASTAILVARIPIAALQIKATTEITTGGLGVLSTRSALVHIERNYMLKLKDAPFKTGDATLCPAAGACTSCPKRTGNAPELFADVAGADVCTDPPCFAAKRDAHVIRIRVAAEAKGQVVISGKAAQKIKPSNYGALQGGYVDLDDTFWNEGKNQTYRKALGKTPPVATLLEDPHKAGMIEIVKRDDLIALLADKGIEISKGGQGIDLVAKAREKAQESAAAIEKEYRHRLFVTVSDAAPPGIDLQTLRDAAVLLLGRVPMNEQSFIHARYGWDKSISDWPERRERIPAAIGALDDDKLHRLIRDLALVDELAINTYSGNNEPPQRLLDLAFCVGVDAGQIRSDVEAEARAKLDAKAAKAEKKKPAKAAA